MQLSQARLQIVHSWERDACERTQLALIRTETSIQLAYHNFDSGESGLLLLSAEEACKIGSTLLALADFTARWGGGQPPAGLCMGDEGRPTERLSLRVCMTNRGEPYEDGVLIDIEQPGRAGLYATLDKRQARLLGDALAGAAGACE